MYKNICSINHRLFIVIEVILRGAPMKLGHNSEIALSENETYLKNTWFIFNNFEKMFYVSLCFIGR